jgi:hypothetical protein
MRKLIQACLPAELVAASERRGNNLTTFKGRLPSSQGQNLALTVLYVPHLLESGKVCALVLAYEKKISHFRPMSVQIIEDATHNFTNGEGGIAFEIFAGNGKNMLNDRMAIRGRAVLVGLGQVSVASY